MRKIALSIVPAAFLAICYLGDATASVTANGITLVSPVGGQTVSPGATVPVSVEVDSTLGVMEVYVSAQTFRTGMPSKTFTHAPYVGVMKVPSDYAGKIKFSVLAKKADGGFVDGPVIEVAVVPADHPVSLEVDPWTDLTYPQPTSGSNPGRKVFVRGKYADGGERIIDNADLGTTFESSDTSIVAVDPNGMLTAMSPGFAVLTVRNGPVKAWTVVAVASATGQRYPIVDMASRVQITRGGLRKDPETGLFAQDLIVKNTSSVPLPGGLTLILDSLTRGVILSNAVNRTSIVAPVGSPLVRLGRSNPPYIAPGESGAVTLMFRNPEGAPINYNVRLFSGTGL